VPLVQEEEEELRLPVVVRLDGGPVGPHLPAQKGAQEAKGIREGVRVLQRVADSQHAYEIALDVQPAVDVRLAHGQHVHAGHGVQRAAVPHHEQGLRLTLAEHAQRPVSQP
jgi:hypothetical protein